MCIVREEGANLEISEIFGLVTKLNFWTPIVSCLQIFHLFTIPWKPIFNSTFMTGICKLNFHFKCTLKIIIINLWLIHNGFLVLWSSRGNLGSDVGEGMLDGAKDCVTSWGRLCQEGWVAADWLPFPWVVLPICKVQDQTYEICKAVTIGIYLGGNT